MNQLT